MMDQGRFLLLTEQYDEDGQEEAPTYTPGASTPCRFRWSGPGDTDRTSETDENVTGVKPWVWLPLTTYGTLTSRAMFELTHQAGEALAPSLVFAIKGQPLPSLTGVWVELEANAT